MDWRKLLVLFKPKICIFGRQNLKNSRTIPVVQFECHRHTKTYEHTHTYIIQTNANTKYKAQNTDKKNFENLFLAIGESSLTFNYVLIILSVKRGVDYLSQLFW